jgi:hypothetical protein
MLYFKLIGCEKQLLRSLPNLQHVFSGDREENNLTAESENWLSEFLHWSEVQACGSGLRFPVAKRLQHGSQRDVGKDFKMAGRRHEPQLGPEKNRPVNKLGKKLM